MNPVHSPVWNDVVSRLRLRVLPHSSFVPIDVWLADPRTPSRVVRLLARGTTVRLLTYARDDLTALLLRAECDCEEHRLAGAVGRLSLRPGAEPLEESSYDGAARHGWTSVEAALLRPDEVAPLLEQLWSSRATALVAAPA